MCRGGVSPPETSSTHGRGVPMCTPVKKIIDWQWFCHNRDIGLRCRGRSKPLPYPPIQTNPNLSIHLPPKGLLPFPLSKQKPPRLGGIFRRGVFILAWQVWRFAHSPPDRRGTPMCVPVYRELVDLRVVNANPLSLREKGSLAIPSIKTKTHPIGWVFVLAEREGFEPSIGY